MKFNQIRKNAACRVRISLRSLFARSLTLLALLVAAIFVGSCGGADSEAAGEQGGATARQIIENPAGFVGKKVTVSGDVKEIWGPRAFSMDSGLTAGELLVIGREPFPGVVDKGANTAYVVNDATTVTGVVRMLVTADIEREIGWDLDPRIEAEFNAKPVLVAQSVSFRPGANRAAANHNAGANQSSNDVEITDYLIIVAEPNRTSLIGRRVRLTGVQVQSVVGDRTFYVGPSESQRILVLLDEEKTPDSKIEGKVDVDPGQTVSFTGVIERMPSIEEARNRFGRLMNDKELNKLRDQQIFIHTDSVDVVGRR